MIIRRVFVSHGFDGLIDGSDAHHITKVMRAKVGEQLVVCDGDKREAVAVITHIDAKSVQVSVGEWRDCKSELPVKLTAFLAVSKGDRMDYAVQKCVELGATDIRLFLSSRCIAKAEGNKVERWQKIASQAAVQSGRGIVPQVYAPVAFESAVEQATGYELPLFCYEMPIDNSLKCVLPDMPPKSIAIMCGPEGGFSEQEASLAMKSMTGVSLGPRILRCETAPVAAAAMISLTYG